MKTLQTDQSVHEYKWNSQIKIKWDNSDKQPCGNSAVKNTLKNSILIKENAFISE